jgi:hypothetical protein
LICALSACKQQEARSFENYLDAGDGLAITDENTVAVRATTASEVLLFNLAQGEKP